MSNSGLDILAARIGVQRLWTDAAGHEQAVDRADLRLLVEALGWPCTGDDDIRDSLQRQQAASAALPPLITTTTSRPELPPALRGAVLRLTCEHGGSIELRRQRDGSYPPLPRTLPAGYHRLSHADGETILAVAPPRCFGIGDLDAAPSRRWGLVAQVYALRSRGDCGFGDFGSLRQCAIAAGAAGAGALAISPVHALFLADPAHCAPYSPSSRLCLNALYADPRVAFAESDIDIAAAQAACDDPAGTAAAAPALIDWPAASRRKLALLRRLYALHAARSPQPPLRYDADDPLHAHACFETLHAHLSHAAGHVLSLADWPSDLAAPHTNAVREFAAVHADELQFHAWLQQLARRSLTHVQAAAVGNGMPLGLIADLAVGSDPNGSDMWARRPHMLGGAGIGAPPDAFNRLGQAWGLTTFSPLALRRHAYAPWLRMLRAVMRDTGGIRIDHAMGLARLWLVPQGRQATHGAYVHLPADDLLRLLALESWRQRAVVIGEDLGTVPPALRQRLRQSGLLGMSVLWFEHTSDGAYLPPMRWPGDAVAMSGTHDLPTLAGWWGGRDPGQPARSRHRAVSPTDRRQRQHERSALWQALHARPAPTDGTPQSATGTGRAQAHGAAMAPPPPTQPAAFVDAVCDALATSPAPLVLLPMEDLVASTEQVNVPGTTVERPNWRQRDRERVEDLFARADVRHRLDILATGRAR